MIKKILPKEDFVTYINEIRDVMEYHKSLNDLFKKRGVDGYLFSPDCTHSLIRLLNNILQVEEQDSYIEKFCFDADFGKKLTPRMFLDENGCDVVITSPDELYDLLLRLYENK